MCNASTQLRSICKPNLKCLASSAVEISHVALTTSIWGTRFKHYWNNFRTFSFLHFRQRQLVQRLSQKNISLCGEIMKLGTLVGDPWRMGTGELCGPRFLRPPRFATSCSAASARRPARGTASVTGQTAVHFTVCLRWTMLWKLS